MSYLQRVAAARNAYLDAFAERKEAFRAQVDVCRSELMVRLHGETPLLGNLYVFDTAGVDETRFCAHGADAEEVTVGETVQINDGKTIVFHGLCWNRTQFRTTGAPLPLDQIAVWFEKWIGDPSDQGEVPHTFVGVHEWFAPYAVELGWLAHLPGFARRLMGHGRRRCAEIPGAVNDEGFRGVIHGCTLRNDNEIAVDFGTAPVGAFDELVTILEQSDATEIAIRPEREGRDLYQLVIELLQTQHDKDNGRDPDTAADAFFELFAAQAGRFSNLIAEMRALEIERSPKDVDRAFAIREEILAFTLPLVKEINEDLIVDFTNGESAPNGLIISAGGNPDLVETVRGVVARAPDIPGWEIIALRPPAPLNFAVDLDVPDLGPVSVDADMIRASLRPRLDRIDVAVHIAGATAQLRLVLEDAAEAAVERVLGEVAFLEAVGDVSVPPSPVDDAATFPINELPTRFAAAIGEARALYESLSAHERGGRQDRVLHDLEPDIAAFETVFADFGPVHDVRVRLDFWTADEGAIEKIEESLQDFRTASEPCVSFLGPGWNIVAVGIPPVRPDALRTWLADTVGALVDAGAIPVRVSETELYVDGMIEELDQKATELLDNGEWAQAAQLMRPAAGAVRRGRTRPHACQDRALLSHGRASRPRIAFFHRRVGRGGGRRLEGRDPYQYGNLSAVSGPCPGRPCRITRRLSRSTPAARSASTTSAMAYALIGNPEQACVHLRKAAALDPDHAKRVMEDPDLNPIRSTEPFVALARELAA